MLEKATGLPPEEDQLAGARLALVRFKDMKGSLGIIVKRIITLGLVLICIYIYMIYDICLYMSIYVYICQYMLIYMLVSLG